MWINICILHGKYNPDNEFRYNIYKSRSDELFLIGHKYICTKHVRYLKSREFEGLLKALLNILNNIEY